MINTSNADGGIAFARSGRYDALPTRSVIWGDGCRNQLPTELSRLGSSRVLLLTTESLTRQAEYVQHVRDLLAERHIATISSLPAHVPAHALDAAWSSIVEARPDLIVAFGGGSVIDAAKAIAVRLREKVDHAPDIIALPTTLSGAEYAHVYGVLEDGDHGLYKRTYVDPDVTPRIVFLDPTLTLATPDRLWLSSAIKALDHAIEGFLQPGERPITDILALVGIRRLAKVLRDQSPLDTSVRLAAQIASWMCYFAPATSRTGLSHRIGYVLGGYYRVPHSLTSCFTLAPVLDSYSTLEPHKLAAISSALGGSSAQGHSSAELMAGLLSKLGLPHRLRDAGVAADDIPRIGMLVRHHFPQDCIRMDALGPDAFDQLILSLW